ncbi:MAG: type II toxin-antitoxin system RelE/ParE family toxin [Oceanicaulis sp.]
MADWELSQKAIQDLREIAIFSGENWGVEQSDAYLEALYAVIYRAAEYPELGAQRHDLASGLRMTPARRHRLFYMSEGRRIVVVRVLHGAQNEAEEFASPL